MEEKTYKLVLNLTKRQMDLLVNATSDLGDKERDCLVVQKEVINATLLTDYYKNIE